MSNLNYCGRFFVHHIILVYFLTKTDIISLHVNVDDSNVQNKQICAGLSLRAGGRRFSMATKRVAPGYFYWKIGEK